MSPSRSVNWTCSTAAAVEPTHVVSFCLRAELLYWRLLTHAEQTATRVTISVCWCGPCVCVCLRVRVAVEKIDRRNVGFVFIDRSYTRVSVLWAPSLQETSSVTDLYHPQTLRRVKTHTHTVAHWATHAHTVPENVIQSHCVSPLPQEVGDRMV